MMHYTNRDQFIVSAPGCMYTDPDSLESIMAGNEGGATGCTLPLDMTGDGIAVLCSRSGFAYFGGLDPAAAAAAVRKNPARRATRWRSSGRRRKPGCLACAARPRT